MGKKADEALREAIIALGDSVKRLEIENGSLKYLEAENLRLSEKLAQAESAATIVEFNMNTERAETQRKIDRLESELNAWRGRTAENDGMRIRIEAAMAILRGDQDAILSVMEAE